MGVKLETFSPSEVFLLFVLHGDLCRFVSVFARATFPVSAAGQKRTITRLEPHLTVRQAPS